MNKARSTMDTKINSMIPTAIDEGVPPKAMQTNGKN
jgi:hypothetical protein